VTGVARKQALRGAVFLGFLGALLVGYVLVLSAFDPRSIDATFSALQSSGGAAPADFGREQPWTPFAHGPPGRAAPPAPDHGAAGAGEAGSAEGPDRRVLERFTVSGMVADADGRPLPGVPIEVWDEAETDRLTFAVIRTDGSGRFTAVSPERRFTLKVPGEDSLQGSRPELSLGVTVSADEESLEGVHLVLERPRVELAGSVRAPDGRPLPGIGVRIYDQRGSLVGQTVTGGRGEYLLPGLDHGAYRLALQHPVSPAGLWYGGGSDADSATIFELRSSARLDLVAPPLASG
jgi:hypothetical protein